jgi:hypothetical protein
MRFHSKREDDMAKITNVDLETSEFIVRKKTLDSHEWIEVWWKVANDDGSDSLVWEGPISVWLDLRLLFNEMFLLLIDRRPKPGQAFPAHENAIENDSDGWPL